MVELNSKYLEDQMINQIAAVRKDMIIPVWVHSSPVRLKLQKVIPEDRIVCLGSGTEIIIAPLVRKPVMAPQDHFTNILPKKRSAVCRVQISSYDSHAHTLLYINRQHLKKLNWEDGTFVTINAVHVAQKGAKQNHNSKEDTHSHDPRTASFRVYSCSDVNPGQVVLNSLVAKQLKICSFSRVKIKYVDTHQCGQVDHITLEPVLSESAPKNTPKKISPNLRASILLELTEWIVQQCAQYHCIKSIHTMNYNTTGTVAPPPVNRALVFDSDNGSTLSDQSCQPSQQPIDSLQNASISYALIDHRNQHHRSTNGKTNSNGSTHRSVLSPKKSQLCRQNFGLPPIHPLPTQLLTIPLINGTIISLQSGLYRMYINLKFQPPTSTTTQNAHNLDKTVQYFNQFVGVPVFQENSPHEPPATITDVTQKREFYDSIQRRLKDALSESRVFLLDLQLDSYERLTHKKPVFGDPPEEILNTHVNQLVEGIGKKLDNHVTILEHCVIPSKLPGKQESEEEDKNFPSISSLGGADSIIETISSAILYSLSCNPLSSRMFKSQSGCNPTHVLISGKHGTGKSTIGLSVANYFSCLPEVMSYVGVISCATFVSVQRISEIKTKLDDAFEISIERQPSILILDDLDMIASAEEKDQARQPQNPLRSSIITNHIMNFITDINKYHHAVVIIATAQNPEKLHPELHLPASVFPVRVTINPPNQHQMKEILEKLVGKKNKNLDLEMVSRKCEGYLPVDLCQLVERAAHIASMRLLKEGSAIPPSNSFTIESVESMDSIRNHSFKTSLILETNDFLNAQKDYTPSSLKGVSLFKSTVVWKDIGGLRQIKKILKETIEYPTKYSFIYKNNPLRHRSGILLYGPPGCGKTMLACAIAQECGLNFITVKGPELLNKYIGASEEAVREKFLMAQAAQPCVLFFDEFDSIAPRRGHDNTGVTDRVVNQFLTALDGVESLAGVYVLAATSRPDLIDPALLRPGRLDRSLFLGIPSQEELVEILRVQTRNLRLGSDVDIELVASWCTNFTGADTRALLYNAQLESIHEHVSQKQRDKISNPLQTGDVPFVIVKNPSKNGEDGVLTQGASTDISNRLKTIQDNVLPTSVKSDSASLNSNEASVITLTNIRTALKEFQPSLSEQECARYSALYSNFVQSRGGQFVDISKGEKKVTHA